MAGGGEGECVYTAIAWEHAQAYIHGQYDVNEDSYLRGRGCFLCSLEQMWKFVNVAFDCTIDNGLFVDSTAIKVSIF
jgi:hypothetical protein